MTNLRHGVSIITELLSNLVPLLIGLALLVFLYGLFGYMMNVGDETKRKESIRYITSGIIGLFLMVSIWGIIELFANSFMFEFGIPKILSFSSLG